MLLWFIYAVFGVMGDAVELLAKHEKFTAKRLPGTYFELLLALRRAGLLIGKSAYAFLLQRFVPSDVNHTYVLSLLPTL